MPRLSRREKQLDRIVEVIRITDITNENPVAREMAMIKVKATPSTRSEIIQIVDIFRSNIVDVSPDSLIIVITGNQEKVDTLVELLRGFGIRELSRTGTIALPRGGAGPLTIEENKPLRHVVEHVAPEEETLPNW